MELVLNSTKPNMEALPGGWEPTIIFKMDAPNPQATLEKIEDNIWVLHDVLSEADCEQLIRRMNESGKAYPVSIQGRKDMVDDRAGSVRATAWCPTLAEQFWQKIKDIIPIKKTTNALSPTDWWQEQPFYEWEAIGVSPLLRFMKYQAGGQHYSHYDAAFIYPDARYRSLMSIVFYLTTNTEGGATRFVKDGQEQLPIEERNHEDWYRETKEEEVLHAVAPKKGSVLIFDHRICHDVQYYFGKNDRIIIRGDLVFQAR